METERGPRMDPRVEERLAIIEQSMNQLDDEATARLIAKAKVEIRDMMGCDENEVEEEVARYLEGKRDPADQK